MLFNDEQILELRDRITEYSRGGLFSGMCELILEKNFPKEKLERYGFRLGRNKQPSIILFDGVFNGGDGYSEGASLDRMYNEYYRFLCKHKKHPDTLIVHIETNGISIISGLVTPFRDSDVWMLNGRLFLIKVVDTDEIYHAPIWRHDGLSDDFLRKQYLKNLKKALQ